MKLDLFIKLKFESSTITLFVGKNRYSVHDLFFLVFKHDCLRCIDFTHIAASNAASDDVTN